MINGIKEVSVTFGQTSSIEKVTQYSDSLTINQNGLRYSHIALDTENYLDETNSDLTRETKNIVLDYSIHDLGFAQSEFDWYFLRLTKYIKELGGEPATVVEAGKPTHIKIDFADGGSNAFDVAVNLLASNNSKVQRKIGKYLRKLVSNVVVIDNLLTEDELSEHANSYRPLSAAELEDMDIFEPYPDN